MKALREDIVDLAIGAAGSTTWERCSVGLPSIIWSIAENQNSIASNAEKSGLCIDLGTKENVTIDKIVESINNLMTHKDYLLAMQEKCIKSVDPYGVYRVTSCILKKLKISIISDRESWMNQYIYPMVELWKSQNNEVVWVHDVQDIENGDCNFFLSCGQVANKNILGRNCHNLVVHASLLPKGRGWSPLTWQILEGKNEIPITLFEADPEVDSGDIYYTDTIQFDGTELISEMRSVLAEKIIYLCNKFISEYPVIVSKAAKRRC